MSEFKFACPVCGQHITSDSSASGKHLECPTCFQKIVVPQAPTSIDSKFILSASQVSKPRPTPSGTAPEGETAAPASKPLLIPIAAAVLFLGVAGAAAFVFRDKLFKSPPKPEAGSTNPVAKKSVPTEPKKTYSIPTNISWSLELTNDSLPETPAAGSIHGSGFLSEKSTLQGGTLNLRQGKNWPPDLGVTVQLFAQQGEELSKKTVEITADRQPPVPKVTLRWKNEADKQVTSIFNSGYAMRIEFGEVLNARVPGKIYLALPDDAKSVIVGSFIAEIRKPSTPKVKTPKPPKQTRPAP